MSEAHREMATALLDSTFAQFVAGIAEAYAAESLLGRTVIVVANSSACACVGVAANKE